MYSLALLLIVVIVSVVNSAELEEICVPLNFENGLENFDDSAGLCLVMQNGWDIAHYKDIGVEPPHESSTTLIMSLDAMSCISSPVFRVSSTGTVEVIFSFLHETGSLQLIMNQIQESGWVSPTTYHYTARELGTNEWIQRRFHVGGVDNINGFVSIYFSR